MQEISFKDLDDISDISNALGCPEQLIEFALAYPATFYEKLLISKKRSTRCRTVYRVKDNLKNLHKNLLVAIASKMDFPEYIQGFVSRRSIVTNASLHLAQKHVLCLDISNFFESISIESVAEVFLRLQCTEDVSSIFAQLCTLNGFLVQGANTSPLLANLVCADMDGELFSIGQECGCSYSRYADDITFSGDQSPKKKTISQCLERYGFTLNADKWNLQRRGQAQYVTGLTVFDGIKPRLPKDMKRKLRQDLYYASKYGLAGHFKKAGITDVDSMISSIHQIDGLIAFMYSVELDCAYKFDMTWQAIRASEGIERSRRPAEILDRWHRRMPPVPD